MHLVNLQPEPKINTHQAPNSSENRHLRVNKTASIASWPISFLWILTKQCCENMNMNKREQRSGQLTGKYCIGTKYICQFKYSSSRRREKELNLLLPRYVRSFVCAHIWSARPESHISNSVWLLNWVTDKFTQNYVIKFLSRTVS